MTQRPVRAAAVALFGGLLLSAAFTFSALGKHGVVTSKEGRSYEGEITEKGNKITIVMKGNIPVEINRGNVESIEYSASTRDLFDQKLAKLDKKDSAGRVELAKWAVDKKEYDLAMDALDDAIRIDPSNEGALQMRKVVQSLRVSARKTATQPAPAPRTGAAVPVEKPGAEPVTSDRKSHTPIRLVTPTEINRIRQLELQKTDNVRVTLQNQVKQHYINSSGIPPQEFNKMTPFEQAKEILDNGSSKLRADVVIATDPATLDAYKKNIQRTLLPGCASSACHGAPTKAGGFMLHNPSNKEAETYTNFLLLQDYKVTVDKKDEYALVDRSRPEKSLLLLYGLPPRDSAVPHPEAQNYHPMFKGKNDPKYKQFDDWIAHSLAPLAPQYGIDLTKEPEEGSGATTRPSNRGARAAE